MAIDVLDPVCSVDKELVRTISDKVAVLLMASLDIEVNVSNVAVVCRIQRSDLPQERSRILCQWMEVEAVDEQERDMRCEI